MAGINFAQGAPGGQSGNEVLGYKGDAAMAGGFDSSGIPAGTGADSLATINDMLQTVNRNQFVTNATKFKLAVDNRDKTLALMDDPDLMMSHDIMDQDRPALDEKRKAIEEAWQKTPNMMANPQAYLEFKNKMSSFKELAASSKSRNVEYKRQMLQIAADNNIENRNSRLKHLDAQVNSGAMHQIDPYFANPTFDADKYFRDVPAVAVGNPEFVMDKDGVAKAITVNQTPVVAFKAPFSPQLLMANGGQGLQDIQILHDNFAKSDFAKDENYLRSINEKLNLINTENNISPSDPNYFKPVAKKVGDDWVVTDSPADLAAGLYAYKGYKRAKTEDLSEKYQKQKLDYTKNQSQLAKDQQTILTQKALAEQYKANAEHARQKGLTEEADRENANAEMAAPVADAMNAFTEATNAKNYKSITSLPANIQSIITANGYDGSSQVAVLPKDEKYIKMLSDPAVDDKGKNSGVINKATNIIAMKNGNDPTKTRLFGFDSKGKLIKSVDLANGVDEIIKFNQGYKVDDKINDRLEAARRVLTDQLNKRKSPVSDNSPLPAPVAKIAGASSGKAINVPGRGTFYNVGGKYYDANGNEITD